jgi:hypothetical protein
MRRPVTLKHVKDTIIIDAYVWYHASFSLNSALKTAIFAIYSLKPALFSSIVGNVQRFDRRLQNERSFFPAGKAKPRKSA